MSEKELKQLAEKKKAIFESTLELIKENGFHGTPMSQVAKRAGVACGTIYHYFDSKDTLILELHAYIKEQMTDALLQNDDQNQDFKSRLMNYWRKHFQFYIQHPDYLFFMEQFVNSPYYNRCPDYHGQRFQSIIVQFIEDGISTGKLKPIQTKLMGVIMHANIITAAKIYLGDRIQMSEVEVEQYFEFIWDGVKM